ncbi:NUDIX hydrolase [Glutamicibacter sp.]|uniref:NUDIX hydrolase n=1 Tax=Glutamicibacter sp. TaxID=1931995 RepID=UPI0028BF2DFC|nr:NUDIX hydrolase [Glutamicibacter sp.]
MSTEHLSDPPQSEVPVRQAASVLLLRPAGTGFEVFVQHRVNTMDFAAGMVVYPGGRVDPQDATTVANGELPEDLIMAQAQRWATSSIAAAPAEQRARKAGMVLAAARREVFEETGLLLDPEQLHPWANWVTPVKFPKRFDTYFFIAALREGQEPAHQTTEAVISRWVSPEALFASLERGEIKMMRPTQRTLLDAMALGSIDRIIASQHEILTVHPDGTDTSSATPVRDSELRERA